MVDYSTLTELELYRDAQTGEFIARDPDTSTEYAVPFEELNAGTATADTANIGSANIDSLGQGVNANGNDISNVGAFDSDSVNTDEAAIKQEGPTINAWAQDGGDAETRLDNATSSASGGDVINLEKATYANTRTLSNNTSYYGTEAGGGNVGTEIDSSAVWSVGFGTLVFGVGGVGEIDTADKNSRISHISDLTVTVGHDNVQVISSAGLSVTFQSGTSGGLIDSCTRTTVTDNGNNTVGNLG